MNIHNVTFARSSSRSQPVALRLNGHNQTSLQTVKFCSNPPGSLDVFELEL